jgi:type I restriction enzyme R subunit
MTFYGFLGPNPRLTPLDEGSYTPRTLDGAVGLSILYPLQTPDQIRTSLLTLRDRWQTDHFPQWQALPRTLVFAKDDNHAEAIVGILREEWGSCNEFAQKLTYRTTGSKREELIKAFCTSDDPRPECVRC